MILKRVADLKRLPVGTVLRQTVQGFQPIEPRLMTIAEVRTKWLVTATRTFISIPKAGEFRATDKGYQRLEADRVLAEYEIVAN